MGPSSSESGGTSKKRPGAKVPTGQRADSPEDMVCDPPISKSVNVGTTEDEGNAKQRLDAARPTQIFAGMQIPELGIESPSMLFDSEIGGTDVASFASWLQIAPTQENSDFSSYRQYGINDIIRFQQDKIIEIKRAACQKILEVEASLTATHRRHQAEIAELEDQHQHQAALSRDENQVLLTALEESKSTTEELAAAKLELAAAKLDLQGRDKMMKTTQDELSKEKKRSSDLKNSQESILKEMNDIKLNFEAALSREKDAGRAKDDEVQRLGSIIKEREKTLREHQSAKDQLTSQVENLLNQLAVIEKKSAQESSTSGSYSEGRANPSMLVTAAQTIDNAMDTLTKFLYDNSLMSGISRKSPHLEIFLGSISRASPGDFTRPVHMKHVWGHWICGRMFQGFEHVYFDAPADRTSPLDLEKHALDCFLTYQQKKDVPSLDYYKECGFFREFCTDMFSLVFPTCLVADASLEDTAKPRKCGVGFGGSWEEPADLKRLFLDVAKAIWLLHELAFSFHPPASILRMGWGEPFVSEYHEAVIKDEDNVSMKVVLMLRPGFRVRKSVIKSRVFLSKF